jgi:hypothetical protein
MRENPDTPRPEATLVGSSAPDVSHVRTPVGTLNVYAGFRMTRRPVETGRSLPREG